jgi:hypothetical protein
VHLLPWASGCNESVGLAFQSNNNGNCYVSSIGTCTDIDIIIPSVSPAGDRVISIRDGAFEGCGDIISVVIPDSVTTIGSSAFTGCYSLTSIVIPVNATTIGNYAFENCSDLASIVIPDNITSIGNYVFINCDNLTDVYYAPSSEKWNNISIGDGNESLTNATIHYDYADNFMSVNDKLGDISIALDNIILQTEAILGYSAAQQLAEEAAKQSTEEKVSEEEGGNE